MATVTQIGPRLDTAPTCAALGLPRATYYRRRRPQSALPARAPSPRALSAGEQATVLDVLHEPRFVDLAPAEVYATLLDEGHYHCSERTMYRLLAAQHEGRDRQNQLRHPHDAAPELLARQPNELWSWDVTKLLGPAKWTDFYGEHHHSSLGLLTPHDVHFGLADERVAARATTLATAYAIHPERFPRGLPQPPARPEAVWINAPKPSGSEETRELAVTRGGVLDRARPGQVFSAHRSDVDRRGCVEAPA